WTGRQARAGKRGVIPEHLQPILARLNIQTEAWLDTVCNFGRWFHRAAGGVDRLLARAHRAGCRWFHGVTRSRLAFG
ncbi:MAG: transposase, partial [Planctomycetes bacterium]|nr:transposase [Planctomycetota bacterium]